MRTVPLGRTGEQVSALALGCMLMGTSTDEDTSTLILERYLDAGGTFLDTADCYAWWPDPPAGAGPFTGGESESLLGRWFAKRGRRDEVFLATKGSAWVADPAAALDGRRPSASQYAGAGADTLRHALDASLRRLGVDHVDLYYVHVDDLATPLEETLEALAGLVGAGKTRHIGWSNVSTARLERIAALCAEHGWPAPVAVQQEHSYLRPTTPKVSIVDDEQLAYVRAHPELTLVAYSPILKGIYDDPAKRGTHHVMQSYRGGDTDARLATVARVAAGLGVTGNQLVLAWLLHQRDPERVTLIGPRTAAQYDAAVAALDVTLDAATLDALGTV
ncbi:aldo/keto reductase [Dactylosporangium aurantiacum]|uniref:Aldo/keto reductase n=1 Tax=Dactylosporangium aurantiacum TaxID=35754 RepID=A0A9Q9ICL3_9ACTN|nr:aldo/keto reductase [Dactylosporangium aurantiacum]MDG6103558.1 aldo/keto reductase [Dactylosporangium aurantiacum]UWZ51948.1 aldo/keto reductase [Dactylosporangium aurantiacum]